MGQAGPPRDDDGWVLLRLLPADGSPADGEEVRRRLGWTWQRYAGACRRLTPDVTITVTGTAGSA